MKSFGEEFVALRHENRISLRDLSRATGYDSSNWSKVERNLIKPPNHKTLKVALGMFKLSTAEKQRLLDLADVSGRKLPEDIPQEDLLKHIPVCLDKARKLIKARKEGKI